MKTLVIHPKDPTTDFLCDIYSDKNWTIINKHISKSDLRKQINSHDRIVMLGHGSEHGLFDLYNKRFVIDSKWVDMLRKKECVCIWCNANIFFEKYKLTGFYTGMIVSEIMEAYLYSLPTDIDLIEESNKLFATSIKESIDTNNILENAKNRYDTDKNLIIDFNKDNLYYNGNR